MPYDTEKERFLSALREFLTELSTKIAQNNQWTMRGFLDIFRNVYSLSTDTKVISKALELHLFPLFLDFAEKTGYVMEPASHQNWYPDLTFISNKNNDIKFAVDLKTTYRDEKYPGFCNGFTLGSHGEYFIDRNSDKNVQYPYGAYAGHFCVGIIYSRNAENREEQKIYRLEELGDIPAVIGNFTFFTQEKWRIASDKQGSGNTANIGSVTCIDDLVNGNGVFAKAGDALFHDYWANFGKMEVPGKNGAYQKLSSFSAYLRYRGLPESLYNPPKTRRRR